MKIKIAARLRPFSHLPGATCLIPKSFWKAQVFPTLLKLQRASDGKVIEVPLDIQGPVKNFTVEVDLEKGKVHVFGETPHGFLRYFLYQSEEGIQIAFEKTPSPKNKSALLVKEPLPFFSPSEERLSLGRHRSQDWELVKRRSDLSEIFPVWLKLASFLPHLKSEANESAYFLEQGEALIKNKERIKIKDHFESFFYSSFYSLFTPRLFDDDYQGLIPSGHAHCLLKNPLSLLQNGAQLIRSLFIQETKDTLALLPCLPPEFHAGRFTNIQLENGWGELDIEWSKKLLRRVTLRARAPRKFHLNLQKPIESFRLLLSPKGRGKIEDASASLTLEAGETIYLDRFQK